MRIATISSMLVALVFCVAGTAHGAQVVKVTPLGSHDGEFCALDRALVFEDPDGTRILYDPGRTVRGPDDPRLGRIDAVLLTHVHADHLGDAIQPSADAGTCAKPDFSVKVAPRSNVVDIVAARRAKLFVGGEMAKFFARKVAQAGGDASQVQLLRAGATARLNGVGISSVPAVHSNGLEPAFLEADAAQALESSGLTAYLGPPGGFVLQFSNGLVAYLSGDTGIIAEQELVRRFYKASLVVMNIGGAFTTGPAEAAFVVNELVKPVSVIASHANEQATRDGKLVAGTKTDAFRKAARMRVQVPLSGHMMEFDPKGSCTKGCTR